jgi:hypothetical protein
MTGSNGDSRLRRANFGMTTKTIASFWIGLVTNSKLPKWSSGTVLKVTNLTTSEVRSKYAYVVLSLL